MASEIAAHRFTRSRRRGRIGHCLTRSQRRRRSPPRTVAVGSGLNERAVPRAFTLIELLIVVAIMVIIAAFLIPAVKPALQDRKVREAARMTNAFFAAQARAIERGRPVGVWMERNPNSPNESMQLFMAEAPLPYSGDFLDAQSTVNGAGGFNTIGLATFDNKSQSLPSLVKPGDKIRFDFKGPFYTVLTTPAVGAAAPFQIQFTHPSAPPPQSGPAGVPYQIERQPTRNSATTFAFPTTTSLNFTFSGAGAAGQQFAATSGPYTSNTAGAPDATPLIVMFSPSGRLDRVYFQGNPVQATESLYFFVTRNNKQAADGSPDITTNQNLKDMSNLWVVVGHRTGAVMTIDNANDPSNAVDGMPTNVLAARRFALERTSKGGR